MTTSDDPRGHEAGLPREFGRRVMLWVDGVGGYLACLSPGVTLGSPGAEEPADVVLTGPISREHAMLRQDGEAWVFDPKRPCRIDGQRVDRPTALAGESRLSLGDQVELTFRQPHPLSLSATVQCTSGHRYQPPADGVLLWADSLLLGAGADSHVRCREASGSLVLVRGSGVRRLAAVCSSGVTVDGRRFARRAELAPGSVVEAAGLTLTLQQIATL